MVKPVVIAWSARPDGGTFEAIAKAMDGIDFDLIDLSQKNFSDYDPLAQNLDDDFLEIAEHMVQHNPIILASPVYWYSVPSVMKRFLDRWSDLLSVRKDIARKMLGKELYLISAYGTYPDGVYGYEPPLQNTATYMGMKFGGCFYYYTGENKNGLAENPERLEEFRVRLTG